MRLVVWKLGGRDGQYGQADTGMREVAGSGAPGVAELEAGEAWRQVFGGVAAAVR